MDKEIITHCELLEDRLILITESGNRLCLDRDQVKKLAFGIVHYKDQADSANLTEILQPDFNWRLLRSPVIAPGKEHSFRACGPTNWKPRKTETPPGFARLGDQ